MDKLRSKEYSEALDNLKIYDKDHLYEFEQAHLPKQNSFRINITKSYRYKGITYQYRPNKIFLRVDLPFTDTYDRGIFTCSLIEAIDHKIVKPFLIFKNGLYLDWDKITLVIDWSVSYMIIDLPFEENMEFTTITFPYDIIINDGATLYDIDERTLFMFDEEGRYINYSRFKTYLKNRAVVNDDTNFGYNADWPQHINPDKYESGGTAIETGEQGPIWAKVIENAFSSFPDGSEIEDDSILYRPGDTYIMVSMKHTNPIMAHYTGRYTNWYANLYIAGLDNKYLLGPANFICFSKDGKFISNDNVHLDEYNDFSMTEIGMYFDMFYYLFNNKSLNNGYIVANRSILDNEDVSKKVKGILEPFEMKYDKNKSYETNVQENQNKIYYHPDIISDINDKHTPINTISIKGEDFIKAAKEDGFVHVFRSLIKDHETESCFIMVFNNGELLRNYHETRYHNSSFLIPVDHINPDDNIELVYFTHVDNRRFDITIKDYGMFLNKLSDDINVDDIELYCRDSHRGFKFNIHNKPSVYIPVEYDNDGERIRPKEDYYYNRPMVMCSSKQFHHYSFVANSYNLSVRLPREFDLCNKKENYIVFINGRKQNDFHFTEMTDTRPFFEKSIYLHKMYSRGDIIDIFYLPYKAEILDASIDEYGNITSSRNLYFNKNNSLIFINGKKVAHEDIGQTPMNGLRLLKDYNSRLNPSVFILSEPSFNQPYYSDLWNTIGNLPNAYKDELLWLPSLGELPENDMIKITEIMGISRDNPENSDYAGGVLARIYDRVEYHRSIMMTGKMFNGLDLKIVEHAKNTIDDNESDMCSDELTVPQVLYEIIKDYYVIPNIIPDKGIYSGSFYYDYDGRIVEIDRTVLDPENVTDTYIIRLLTAFNFDKVPQVNVLT